MLLIHSIPKSNPFQITDTISPMNNDEFADCQSSESMIDDTRNSVSAITIPLILSQPIVAVSSNYILVNECTKKRKQLILIDDNLKRFSINSSITEPIIDTVWYEIEKKFFLLTTGNIFTCDPNKKIIQKISDIKSDTIKPFKSFTIMNNQSSLLIAYDEWESKFIDRWEQDTKNNRWILVKSYPLNLNSNEFIGTIIAINEDDCLNLGITIYDNLTQQWRMEVRCGEILTCVKKVLLPGSNTMYDYEIIPMKNLVSEMKWLVYSQVNNEIIATDSNWKKIYLYYKFPIYKMVQFKKNNLIIRTRNRIDIHLFV